MTVQRYDNKPALQNLLTTALDYHKAGLKVIPVNSDKRPACKGWKQYQGGQTELQVKELFAKPAWGIAILTGKGIEALDIDAKYWQHSSDLFQDFMRHNDVKNANACPITSMCVQSTVNGGYHIIYRCTEIEGNKKLAQRPATAEEAAEDEKVKVLLETRGEGGYIVAAPSLGYAVELGSFIELPEITPDQRSGLFAAARDFDETDSFFEAVAPTAAQGLESTETGATAWDDYNQQHSALDLLTAAGWKEVYTRGERVYLKRPGDTAAAYSGNYHTGKELFICFSSSTQFEPEKAYTAFGVYAVLQHNGDFSAAAKALYAEGYGERIERKSAKRAEQLSKTAPPVNAVLAALLDELAPIDFRERLELEDDEKVKQKHAVVAIIDEIIQTAKRKKWGLCVDDSDYIFVYNGQHWQGADKQQFKAFLGQAAERVNYDPFECRYFEFRDKLYKQFLTAANFPSPAVAAEKTLINLQNGTLEITPNGATLRGFLRDDFLKYQLPFSYDPSAVCTKFESYLAEVLPDPTAQKVLAEYIGYVFTRHLKLEKSLVLYGSGANGKSVFADVINALIGKENVTNFSISALMEENNRAHLQNALLNYGGEIGARHLDGEMFKTLSSNETAPARWLYGNSFLMQAGTYAKLAFNANELPRDVEQTEGFFRRFLIVPFDVTIPAERRNPNLAREIIANELPGVLNWVLQGLNRILKQNKFSRCTIIEERLQRYRTESDSVYLFLEDSEYAPAQNFTSDFQITQKQLYSEYREFCKEDGYRPLSNRNFGARLEKLNFERKKTKAGQVIFAQRGGVDRTAE